MLSEFVRRSRHSDYVATTHIGGKTNKNNTVPMTEEVADLVSFFLTNMRRFLRTADGSDQLFAGVQRSSWRRVAPAFGLSPDGMRRMMNLTRRYYIYVP